MTRYAADSKERVRDAVDMVDLVSRRTELRRAGADHYTGLCPFHDERTPSFGISPSKKVYNCFGCDAAGDAFSFVMETEGLDFVGALEALADRYGVALEREEEDPRAAERRRRRERLYELLDRTASYYARYLWESGEAAGAREYLAGRGLERAVLERFRVGYAPSAWDRVLVGSRRGGFTDDELLGAGLAQRSRTRPGSIFDRFRGRIMFPLCDRRGRVLGFGARALRDNQQPKYLNTSDNDVYHKGRQLFGADLARAEAARSGSIVVVEGYTDVLALHQAGIENSVGIMGTAVTAEQVAELAQLAGTGEGAGGGGVVQFALDADRAGRDAMMRAAAQAEGRRLDLRVVPLPPGADPADLVRERGGEAMRELVSRSVPFVRFRVEQVLSAGPLETGEAKDRALAELRPVLAGLGPSALREELVRLVADKLDLSEQLVASLTAPARRAGAAAAGVGAEAGSRDRAPLSQAERTERTFLSLCIAQPDLGREALRRVDPDRHFTTGPLRRAAEHLREHVAAPLDSLPEDDPELAHLVSELAVRAEREPAGAATLEVQTLRLDLLARDREIAAAQAAGRDDVARLAAQRTDIKQQFDRALDRATSGA